MNIRKESDGTEDPSRDLSDDPTCAFRGIPEAEKRAL